MLIWDNEHVNFVMDGNSNIAGSSLATHERVGDQLMLLSTINGGMTYKNIALGGATFASMLSGTDGSGISGVHAAFEFGKQNFLAIMETFNSAAVGGTLESIKADCKAFIDAVLAVHPEWRIYLIITPAGIDQGNTGYNVAIDQFNDYVRENYMWLGAEGFVETRPEGGPLAYTPPYVYSETTFFKSGHYLSDGIHWSPAGSGIVAQYIDDMLPSIPDVAPPRLGGGGFLIGGI